MQIINIMGIALNTIGVVLIFRYGLSLLIRQDGHTVIFGSAAEYKEDPRHAQKSLYEKLAMLGLVLCIAGGCLQILGAITR